MEGCDKFTFTREQLAQKKYKRSISKFYTADKEFKGCCGYKFGWATCKSSPWCDEDRLSVDSGDVVRTARGGSKAWMWAERVRKDDVSGQWISYTPKQKGWVPRSVFPPEKEE